LPQRDRRHRLFFDLPLQIVDRRIGGDDLTRDSASIASVTCFCAKPPICATSWVSLMRSLSKTRVVWSETIMALLLANASLLASSAGASMIPGPSLSIARSWRACRNETTKRGPSTHNPGCTGRYRNPYRRQTPRIQCLIILRFVRDDPMTSLELRVSSRLHRRTNNNPPIRRQG